MSVRLIAVDMDGTLLTTDQRITENTQKAIRRAKDKGIEFILGTGRSTSECQMFYPQLDLNYSIFANGAYVENIKTGEELFRKALSLEDAKKIYDIYDQYETVMFIQADHWVHARENFPSYCMKFPEYREGQAPIDLPYIYERDMRSFLENRIADIEKFHVSFMSHEAAAEAYDRLSVMPYKVVWCGPYVVEVTNPDADKGESLRLLAEKLGVRREEVMAMGDSDNDSSMVEYAGISIAMGNASECLKSKATYVVPSNNEEGVAYAIERYALS